MWSGCDCGDICLSQSDVSRYGALHVAADRFNTDFLSDHATTEGIGDARPGVAVAAPSWASVLQHVFDSSHAVSPLLSLLQTERAVDMWDFCFIADVCASDANVGGVTDPKMAWSGKTAMRCFDRSEAG